MDKNKYNTIYDIILSSNNIVFFGGAGVSTASGIPDFRSATGLYNRKNDTGYSPEYMLSHEFLIDNPEGFSKYYKENLIYEDAKPSTTHKVLAKLEKMGKLKAVVTQNIDSLHQMAGSKNVVEIHGNLRDYYCMSCGKRAEVISHKKSMMYFVILNLLMYGAYYFAAKNVFVSITGPGFLTDPIINTIVLIVFILLAASSYKSFILGKGFFERRKVDKLTENKENKK